MVDQRALKEPCLGVRDEKVRQSIIGENPSRIRVTIPARQELVTAA